MQTSLLVGNRVQFHSWKHWCRKISSVCFSISDEPNWVWWCFSSTLFCPTIGHCATDTSLGSISFESFHNSTKFSTRGNFWTSCFAYEYLCLQQMKKFERPPPLWYRLDISFLRETSPAVNLINGHPVCRIKLSYLFLLKKCTRSFQYFSCNNVTLLPTLVCYFKLNLRLSYSSKSTYTFYIRQASQLISNGAEIPARWFRKYNLNAKTVIFLS